MFKVIKKLYYYPALFCFGIHTWHVALTLFFWIGLFSKLYSADLSPTPSTLSSRTIQSRPLAHPNPFRLSDGTHIGYTLSYDLDSVTIMVYNMTAHLILKHSVSYPDEGTQGAYHFNKVPITADLFDSPPPCGIYFYFILDPSHHIIGKGKLAII